jgi:hypothetical protein
MSSDGPNGEETHSPIVKRGCRAKRCRPKAFVSLFYAPIQVIGTTLENLGYYGRWVSAIDEVGNNC